MAGVIVTIGGEKGGSGKSCLARNLAAYFAGKGLDTIIVDGDPQRTSANWCGRRDQVNSENGDIYPSVHCVEKTGDLRASLRDLKHRYQVVVVDVGGRDSRELRTAAVVSDMLISPFRPSQDDIDTLPQLSEIVKQARDFNEDLVVAMLFAQAPTASGSREVEETRALIADYADTLPLMPLLIRERKAYRDTSFLGLGVTEYSSGPAKAEIQLVGQEILRTLAAKMEVAA